MKPNQKVAIVCCSNGILNKNKEKLDSLKQLLIKIGLIPVFSKHIYAQNSIFNGTSEQRAAVLMDFYQDEEIKAIFDISGGEIANEILPYLDFEIINKSNKQFWGYSDLTTVINAIYTKTNNSSVLYQLRNILDQDINSVYKSFFCEKEDLFSFNYEFIQGNSLTGIVVGGNIRCLLKLAGTEYWPKMERKVLFLEALGGTVGQMTTYLSQLKQLGVFEQVSGIILGTFTTMEKEHCKPSIIKLVSNYVNDKLPIIKTNEIGHDRNSKAIIIGGMIDLKK